MNCKNGQKLIRHYYDELQGAEREEFDSHLKACAGCRQELEDLKAISLELARAFEGAEPSQDVLAAIIRRAGRPKGAPFRSVLRRPKWAVSFAGAALLIGLAIGAWIFLRPQAEEAYELTEPAMTADAAEQVLGALSPGPGDDSFLEENLAEVDAELTMLSPAGQSQAGELEFLEQEIEELAVLSRGIF